MVSSGESGDRNCVSDSLLSVSFPFCQEVFLPLKQVAVPRIQENQINYSLPSNLKYISQKMSKLNKSISLSDIHLVIC